MKRSVKSLKKQNTAFRRGFTLLELVIVMALLAVLSGVIVTFSVLTSRQVALTETRSVFLDSVATLKRDLTLKFSEIDEHDCTFTVSVEDNKLIITKSKNEEKTEIALSDYEEIALSDYEEIALSDYEEIDKIDFKIITATNDDKTQTTGENTQTTGENTQTTGENTQTTGENTQTTDENTGTTNDDNTEVGRLLEIIVTNETLNYKQTFTIISKTGAEFCSPSPQKLPAEGAVSVAD